MSRVLVLNNNYFPLATIGWQRAVTLMFKNKVEVLEEYDKEIRAPNLKIKMPAVIRLVEYVKLKVYKYLRFNKSYLYLRDKGLCQYCHKHLSKDNYTIDHVIPKSRGGRTDYENTVLSCYSCNQIKGNTIVSLNTKPIQINLYDILKFNYGDNRLWTKYL